MDNLTELHSYFNWFYPPPHYIYLTINILQGFLLFFTSCKTIVSTELLKVRALQPAIETIQPKVLNVELIM